ncbi:hypothetical protein SH528x_002809 [Novipirellula sp. SH528]|uniref:hypothetical protein n=1 Tax=Novipirellula sp. SH528 TaxID=3454466 RepID=UPI003F9F007A
MANLVPTPSNYEMWRAYAIAPAVTPIVFVTILSIAGAAFSLPFIAAAFLVCYLVAGLVGMPIAFFLRRRNELNARTIHGAALLWGMLWSLFCEVVAISVVGAIGGSIASLPMTTAYIFALMVPPVTLSGTAFWILLKNPKLV